MHRLPTPAGGWSIDGHRRLLKAKRGLYNQAR